MAVNEIIQTLVQKHLHNDVEKILLRNSNEVMSNVERAHWEYQDKYQVSNKTLKSYSIVKFGGEMFKRHKYLKKYANNVHMYVKKYRLHQRSIPSCGVALVNEQMNKVLLVCEKNKLRYWGFPKGKVETGESFIQTAVREVYEEVGLNISSLLSERSHFCENIVDGKTYRIYFLPGIPEETNFIINCHQEIADVRWVPIRDLPMLGQSCLARKVTFYGASCKMKEVERRTANFSERSFSPFVTHLIKWISQQPTA